MRSISQIYSEAVATRNNYLQLTELNTGRSNSKLSMINLLTYVVAVCIHTYEAVLDIFQFRLAEVLNGRINGTPDWYALTAKKFQYNSVTGKGDELRFNEDTMKIEYVAPNTSHRIIERAAWQLNNASGTLILKVCKANTDSNELNNGTPYMPLSNPELTAFKQFIQQIKFIGAEIICQSLPGDILTVIADKDNPIFYDDSYITAAQAMDNIKNAMIEYANSLEFNGMIYAQSVIDVIRKAEYISDVSTGVKVSISTYNNVKGEYQNPVTIKTRFQLSSGYIKLLDENAALTINTDNLTLVPISKINEYSKYSSYNKAELFNPSITFPKL